MFRDYGELMSKRLPKDLMSIVEFIPRLTIINDSLNLSFI